MVVLLRKLLIIAGLLFALIWLLSTVVSGFSAPDWVAAVGLVCTAGWGAMREFIP